MRLGSHLSIAKGFLPAARKAAGWGATSFQFFSSNPRSFRPRQVKPDEAEATRKFCRENDIVPVAHAPYLFNLSTPKEDMWEKTIELVVADLAATAAYGGAYLVVHSGKHLDKGVDEGISRMAEAIDRILADHEADTMLLIENTAGQGSELGSDLDQLAALLEQVAEPERLGFCLDTCHAFVAGQLDPERPLAYFDRALELFGPDRVPMLHVNDSKVPFGARRDRHEKLGQGEMGLDIFREILTHDALQHAVFVLETPVDDEDEYLKEIQLIRGWF